MWRGARSCWAGGASTFADGSGLACAQRAAGRPQRRFPRPINMHSVKNRFLMRIKNSTSGLYRECLLPMAARDLVVVGGAC